jgi:hypothetical protein
MKRILITILCAGMPVLVTAQTAAPAADNTIQYHSAESFLIEGTDVADSLKEGLYDRLPFSYKDSVRTPVWDLSKSSAGLSIRFLSNSTRLKVKWEVLNDFKMNHMAESGIKGLDLYCRIGGQWQFINTARPSGKKSEVLLSEHMKPVTREYRMFLPLYDGLTSLAIGIDSAAAITKPLKSSRRPIVFYGTSITQGGCASRPGMAYTNIISRKLDVDCINFGFSGNGRMERPIVELMAATEIGRAHV